jgi:hypothetical protein
MPFGQYSPFTTITIPGGQVYLPSLSLPPTLLTHNAVSSTTLPKLILPTIKVINYITTCTYTHIQPEFCAVS